MSKSKRIPAILCIIILIQTFTIGCSKPHINTATSTDSNEAITIIPLQSVEQYGKKLSLKEMITGQLRELDIAIDELSRYYHYIDEVFPITVKEIIFTVRAALQENETFQDYYLGIADYDHGDAFKVYSQVYSKFLDIYNSYPSDPAAISSREYSYIVALFLSDDKLKELQYDHEKAGEFLASNFWRETFSENGEDYGAIFANKLYEMAKETDNRLYSNDGKVLMEFYLEDDATFTVYFEDFAELASFLGIKISFLATIQDAMRAYGSGPSYSGEDAVSILEEIDGIVTENPNGTKQVDMSTVLSVLEEVKVDPEDWDAIDLYQVLKNDSNIEVENIPNSISKYF